MKPMFIGNFMGNRTQTDYDIDRAVREDHDMFSGCIDPNGCGKIHFYGLNTEASTEVLNTEHQYKATEDWCEFIKEHQNSQNKFHAIGLTIVKGRINEYGREVLYKETCYINSKKSNAIIFETDLIRNSANGPVFSNDTRIKNLPFRSVASVFSKIFDELGIDW